MNTAKWTLSILLAGCCVLPTLAQAETFHNENLKAKQLVNTKYKGKLGKKNRKEHDKPARRSTGAIKALNNAGIHPLIAFKQIAQLEEIITQRLEESGTQPQAEKQAPACNCQSYQPTPEDWVRAETEVQLMLNTMEPEDLTVPFDYTQEVSKRAHKCTCAPKQQEPAANPDKQTSCPCHKTQPQVAK